MLSDRANQITIDITNLKAEITLRSSLASLTLTQRFQNSSPSPIETTYTIKEQHSAVITSLKAIFQDGSITELRVSEIEQSKEKFQDKLAEGHLPLIGLFENESIELQIGHLPAGQSLEIVASFAFPLVASDNFWKLEMPTAFEPSPSVNFEVYLTVLSEFEILAYNSNWDFDFSLNNNGLTGVFKSLNKVYNHSRLEFLYKTSQNIQPNIIVQTNGDDYAAMLSFIPYCNDNQDIDDYEPTDEFLFIVDRSGSMSGNRIELAKEAAKLFLKSLNNKSKFNIVSFGYNFTFLYPNSVLANSFCVSDAISKISEFSADMGGTEIYRPLEAIYAKALDPGFKRCIFLLTDGDVSSPEMVVKLIENNQNKGKIFSFGIQDANEFLIRESAKKGNGESYYIKNVADIGKNVIKALTSCMSPYVENVKIDLDWDFAPKLENIKWINYGKRFCVFAMGKEMPDGKCVFTCFDSFNGSELRFEIFSREAISGDEIFKLWAKSKIEDDPDNSLKISLKYQVISPKTAFFAYKKSNSTLAEEIIPAKLNKNNPDVINFQNTISSLSSLCYSPQPLQGSFSGFPQPSNTLTANLPNLSCYLSQPLQSAPPTSHQALHSTMQPVLLSCKTSGSSYSNTPPPPPPPPPAPFFASFYPPPSAASFVSYSQPQAPPPSSIPKPPPFGSFAPPPPASPFGSFPPPPPPPAFGSFSPPPLPSIPKQNSLPMNFCSSPQTIPATHERNLNQNSIPNPPNLPCSSAHNDLFGDIQSSGGFLFDLKDEVANYSQRSVPQVKKYDDDLFDFDQNSMNLNKEMKIDSHNLLLFGNSASKSQKINHLSIVLCQDSEGFWDWYIIVVVLKVAQEVVDFENACEDKAVVGTCLALAYLNKFCSGNKEEWVLIEKKAVRWLKKKYSNYGDLIERLKNVLV